MDCSHGYSLKNFFDIHLQYIKRITFITFLKLERQIKSSKKCHHTQAAFRLELNMDVQGYDTFSTSFWEELEMIILQHAI